MTLIDAELECDDESEEASEPDWEDTGGGIGTAWLVLISLVDGAVVSLGALFSCTEDHGAAANFGSVHVIILW